MSKNKNKPEISERVEKISNVLNENVRFYTTHGISKDVLMEKIENNQEYINELFLNGRINEDEYAGLQKDLRKKSNYIISSYNRKNKK